MSDQEKTGTRFEPPPWEKEAFEALARRREEEAEAARIAAEALAGAVVSPAVEVVTVAAAVPAETAVSESSDEGVAASAVVLEERHVQAMLMQLRHEEPRFGKNAQAIGLVAVGFTAVIGLAMLVGGLLVASSSNGKATALAGGAVICIFGLSFLGMSVWVWSSMSRVKGS